VGDRQSLLTCLLQDSVRRSKLDSPLLRQLEGLAKEGTADAVITIMVWVEGPATPPLREKLAQARLMFRAAVGPVISGSIRVADLYHLTGLEAVRLITLPADFHIKHRSE
jgi:hypothetical protein